MSVESLFRHLLLQPTDGTEYQCAAAYPNQLTDSED